MITYLFRLSRWSIQGCLVIGLASQLGAASAIGAPAEPAAKPAAPAATPPTIPKAVFQDDLPTGRDPFFPTSQRRARLAGPTGPTNQVAAVFDPLSQLYLKGISLGKARRLALINNVTLAEGEKAALKFGERTATIICLKIQEDSVQVGVDGSRETRDLQLTKPK